jgi:hypothetical protein
MKYSLDLELRQYRAVVVDGLLVYDMERGAAGR